MRRAVVLALVACAAVIDADAQVVRNAGKYGAMVSWWYQQLPDVTLYPPTIPWCRARTA